MSRRTWQAGTLLAATLTTGLTAGVFADWAHTVMPGLGTTDDRVVVEAFLALDRAILGPGFLLVFLGALVATGVAVLVLRGDRRMPVAWVVAAFVLYLVAVVVTMAVHEPINGAVRAAGADLADPAVARTALQETRWAAWHVVRTVATTVAFGCLGWALVRYGRASAVDDHPGTAAAPPAALRRTP